MLPHALINLVALSLPLFEMIIGAMLVLGIQLRLAAFSVLILSGVFAVVLVSGLARGLQVECGCFGRGDPSMVRTWWSLGRDILSGAMAWCVWKKELD